MLKVYCCIFIPWYVGTKFGIKLALITERRLYFNGTKLQNVLNKLKSI